MSNTTIANVLKIMPQLATLYTPQKDTITVTAANLTTTATIQGIAITVNSPAGTMTKDAIAEALKTAINANATLAAVLIATVSTDTVILTALETGTGYTVAATANCTTANTAENQEIVSLILADVISQCGSNFGALQEQAQRYLAAHYFTLIDQAMASGGSGATSSGPVTTNRVGDVSITFATMADLIGAKAERYDATKYGSIFAGLKRSSVVPVLVI